MKTKKGDSLSLGAAHILNKASQKINRRDFIKVSTISLLGTQMLLEGCTSFQTKTTGVPKRIRKGNLFYRRLGKTDMVVSEISLGGSPIPLSPSFEKLLRWELIMSTPLPFIPTGTVKEKLAE